MKLLFLNATRCIRGLFAVVCLLRLSGWKATGDESYRSPLKGVGEASRSPASSCCQLFLSLLYVYQFRSPHMWKSQNRELHWEHPVLAESQMRRLIPPLVSVWLMHSCSQVIVSVGNTLSAASKIYVQEPRTLLVTNVESFQNPLNSLNVAVQTLRNVILVTRTCLVPPCFQSLC